MKLSVFERDPKNPFAISCFAVHTELDDKGREQEDVTLLIGREQAECLAKWLTKQLYGIEIRKAQ